MYVDLKIDINKCPFRRRCDVYDSNSDKEIQLLVQPCDPDGVPLNRTHDQQIDDARERAAAKAARDEREASRRLLTLVRIRYDMPTRFLRESLQETSSALKPIAEMLERKARSALGDQHRISVSQMRDHLNNERNTLDVYTEFRTQVAHS